MNNRKWSKQKAASRKFERHDERKKSQDDLNTSEEKIVVHLQNLHARVVRPQGIIEYKQVTNTAVKQN